MKVKIVLLAAGSSSRFWPLPHKALFPFFGKPFIKHQLDNLQSAGFTDITIVCNKDNLDQIKTLHSDCILQVGESQGAAILSAKEKVNGSVLVVNAIDYFSLKFLQHAFQIIQNNPSANYLTGVMVDKYFPGGYLVIKDEKIKEIVEKPGAENMPSNIFSLNFDYYADGSGLLKALENVKNHDYEKAKNFLIENGTHFSLLENKDFCASLKYPWHVLDFTKIFLSQIDKPQISPNAQVAPSAIINGNVVIEDGVRVFENAKITGPCYLGKNVIVGNNCIVRESIIEEGCVLGYSADVARSYIGKNCWFHSNYIGDSVLAENISLGAGANLANLRLDEGEIISVVKGEKINSQRTKLGAIIGNNVRIGVNSSIMPGVKIGENTFIGSGIIIDQDIPENKFVTGKTTLVMKDNKQKVKKGREEFRNKI